MCSRCAKTFTSEQAKKICECGAPLKVTYDWKALCRAWHREDLRSASGTMWRYAPVLPAEVGEAVTLAEGWTPLLRSKALEQELGAREIWLKDEGRNPTGSMEARRFSCIATVAKSLGMKKLVMDSAGSAASALAAYAAAAGLEAQLFMPRHVAQSVFIECKALGGDVRLVDGGMEDCARLRAEQARDGDALEAAALDAFGREGAKTIAYEIAEQLGWRLPDALVYAGDESDGMGIEKGFEELEELGWIGSERPRMIAVKPESVRNEDAMDAALWLARGEGVLPGLEAGACVAALRRMLKQDERAAGKQIVMINSGSGLKQVEAYATRYSRQGASEQDKLGGLITPR